MTDTIKSYLTKIEIGAEQSFKNLSIFPVLSDYFIPFDYLTIDDALSKDLVAVLEVRQNRSMPEHKVINKSNRMILIYDGENQAKTSAQRNIGAAVLIPAKEIVVIPESFIKKNRSPNKIKRSRSQGHFKASRDYMENFARVDSQVGALFVINGKVAGMDCFGSPDTFEKTFMKMIEGYAQDAAHKLNPHMRLKSSKAAALNFLQTARESRVLMKQSARMAAGWRLKSKRCSGYALAHEDWMLRLSVVARN
jgi:hypothetical protein